MKLLLLDTHNYSVYLVKNVGRLPTLTIIAKHNNMNMEAWDYVHNIIKMTPESYYYASFPYQEFRAAIDKRKRCLKKLGYI